MWLLGLLACLIETEFYEERRALLTDDDGDGWSEVDGDCDDTDAAVGPAAAELCNDIDDDRDAEVDEDAVDVEAWYVDDDGDGYGDPERVESGCTVPAYGVDDGTDCDDGVAAVHPGAEEVCDNGVDDDCDGGAGTCGLAGERSAAASADASWVVGTGTVLDEAGAMELQLATVVDDPVHGRALLIGLPRHGESGGVYEVPLRETLSTLTDGPAWIPDDGELAHVGQSVVPLPPDGTVLLPAFAAVAHSVDESGTEGESVLMVLDSLPGSMAGDDVVATWSSPRDLVLTGRSDLDLDGADDLVLWSAEHEGVLVLPGPADGLDADTVPVILASSGALLTGSSALVWGGVPAADWNGEGVPRVMGVAYDESVDGKGRLSVAYELGWDDRGVDVENAPFVRRSASEEHNIGYFSELLPLAMDLDQDGYTDLAFPSAYDSRTATFAGSVAVLLGPHADGEAAFEPDHELRGDEALQAVGVSVAAGDFDGDGRPVLAVGWLDDTAAGGGGAVGLWDPLAGAAETVDALQDVVRGDVPQQQAMIARAADVDVDGYDDLVIIAPGTESVEGAIYLLPGGGL